MGNLNCVISQRRSQHVRIEEEDFVRKRKRINESSERKDETDFVKMKESVTASFSSILISTPEDTEIETSTPDSMLSLSPLSRRNGEDTSTGADKPILVSPSPIPNYRFKFQSRSSSPQLKGRALYHRLQKARSLQLAMSSPMNQLAALSETRSLESPLSIRRSFTEESCESIDSKRSFLSNEEFEESLHRSMIWSEVQAQSPVLALAISKQEPTLQRTCPPIFLAVGTTAGLLIVTELIDRNSGSRLGPYKEMQRQGRIRTLDFLPRHGQGLAVAGDDGVCALLGFKDNGDLEQLSEIRRLDRIFAARFSPDAQYLAIGGYDATVAVLDVTTLTKPRLIDEIPVEGLISALAWSPDSKFLAIGGSDKVCSILSISRNWQIVHEIRRSAPITLLEWHPQSSGLLRLAIGSDDVILVFLDSFKIHKHISFNNKEVIGRPAQTRISGLSWSPNNGKHLIVCANNQPPKLLETKTFSTIQEIPHHAHINCVVWGQQTAIAGNGNPQQQYLAVGGDDGNVLILKTGPIELQGTSDDNTSITTRSSHFSNCQPPRQAGSGEGWVLHPFRDIGDDDLSSAADDNKLDDDLGTVRAIAFSRGSKSRPSTFFATASSNGFLTVRSTVGFKILCQLEFLDPITCIAFSNGSRFMACGSNDGSVRVVTTGPMWTVAFVVDAETPVTMLSFSNNNERMAIIGNNGYLTLVDPNRNFADSGDLEQQSTVSAIDWSSDHLAVGQEDGSISIYKTTEIFSIADASNVKASTTITRPSPVRSLAFGANNRFLMTGGDDGTLAIFSSAGNWPLIHCISVGFEISNIKWSPSGKHLAISGTDSNLKKRKLQVLDTVFWSPIQEVQHAVDNCKDIEQESSLEISQRRKHQASSLAFSQDGKLLAFNDEESGTRVVRTLSWDVIFCLQQHDQDAATLTLSQASPDDYSSQVSSPPMGD